jgi:hypothetical protein
MYCVTMNNPLVTAFSLYLFDRRTIAALTKDGKTLILFVADDTPSPPRMPGCWQPI